MSSTAALDKLTMILEHALHVQADAIELEYDSGGDLEVCFMRGNSGAGEVVRDRKLARELTGCIFDLADLGRRNRGKFAIRLHGKEHTVVAECYDSFGEHAYRLKFGKERKKRQESPAPLQLDADKIDQG